MAEMNKEKLRLLIQIRKQKLLKKQEAAQTSPQQTPGGFAKEIATKTNPVSALVTDQALPKAVNAVGRLAEGLGNITPIPVSENTRKIAQKVSYAPRAAGVMASHALNVTPAGLQPSFVPQKALEQGTAAMERGKAAMQPEFQPETTREALGAAAGEMAPFAAAGPMGTAGRAVTMGGLTATRQAADEGEVGPVLAASAIATPVFLEKGAKALVRAKVAKDILDGEKILQAKSAELVREFNQLNKSVNQQYNKTKNALGIIETPAEIEARVARFPRTDGQMRVADVKKALDKIRKPLEETQTTSKLTDPSGRPIVTKTARPIGPQERFKTLALLDKQINNHINWLKPGATPEALALKNSIRTELMKFGDKGRQLVEANKAMSEWLKISNRLKDQVESGEVAASTLAKIGKGVMKRSLSATAQKQLGALKALEKKTGKQFIGPAKQAAAIQAQKPAKKSGILSDLVGVASPRTKHLLDAFTRLSELRQGR